MEKRSGFWKFGEVLGHVPPAPSNARKHEKSLFQGGDFWWRVGGRIASELILGFGAKKSWKERLSEGR